MLWLEALSRKLRSPTLDAKGLRRFVEAFPVEDRAAAWEVLRQTALFGHFSGWVDCWNSLPDCFPKESSSDQIAAIPIVLESHGHGRALAYHLRKVEWAQAARGFLHLPVTESLEGVAGVLVDAISRRPLSEAELEALAKIPVLGVSDHVHLERAPSYADFLTDAEHSPARRKVAEIIQLARQHASVPLEAAVSNALEGCTDENLRNLDERRLANGLPATLRVSRSHRPAAASPDALAPYFEGPRYDPTYIESRLDSDVLRSAECLRVLASEEGLQYHSPARFIAELGALHQGIVQSLRSNGRSIDDAFLISGRTDSVKSEDLVNWLFRAATGWPEERCLTPEEANALAARGKLSAAHTLVFLNDLNGSGATLNKRISELAEEQSGHTAALVAGQLICGHVVQNERWEEAARRVHSSASPLLLSEAIHSKTDFLSVSGQTSSLDSESHPLLASLPAAEREPLFSYLSRAEFEDHPGNHIFFLSRPDNSTALVDAFACNVLGLRHRSGMYPPPSERPE